MKQTPNLGIRAAGRTGVWLLMASLLIFFGLWVRHLGWVALDSDEAATVLMANMRLGGIHRQNQDSPHLPAYNLIMRAWQVTAGPLNEFLTRYPSVLMGMLLLSLVYRGGRVLGLRSQEAVMVVILVGLNPQITLHLREARPYPLMLLSAVGMAVAALRFERGRLGTVIAAGATLLALFSHYFNSPFVGALGLWGVLTFHGRTRRNWVISQGIAWALWIIWVPLMGRAFFNATSLSTGKTWSAILPPWETLYRLIRIGAVGYREAAGPWPGLVAGALLVAGWLVGSGLAKGRQRWFSLGMVALPLISYSLLGSVRPVFHAKFILPWLVFAAWAVGQWLRARPWSGGIVWVGILALMILPTWRTLQKPYDSGAFSTADLSTTPRDLSREVLRLADPNDVFGLGTPDPVHCYYFRYYFDRHLDCALIPQHPAQTAEELKIQVNDLLAQRDVLWYLDYYNAYWDPERIADQVLGQTTLSLGEVEVAGRRLRLYTSPATVLREQAAVGAEFGQAAELEGVWLIHDHSLRLVLVWRSLADRPEVEAKVFVHLVNEADEVVSQDDSVPVNWSRPLTTWRVGEQLLDVHILSLPDDLDLETAALRIGLYDSDTLARLPAIDRDGRPLEGDAVLASLAR